MEFLNDIVKDEVFKIMEYVGFVFYVKWQVGLLFYGQKQWFVILMLVVQFFDIIFLDEFVVGLMDEEIFKIVDLIKFLVGEYIVVVIEYDMEFICDFGVFVIVFY